MISVSVHQSEEEEGVAGLLVWMGDLLPRRGSGVGGWWVVVVVVEAEAVVGGDSGNSRIEGGPGWG